MSDKIILGSSEEKAVSADLNTLIDSRMLIQGNSRSGKSYLARVLCERAAGKVPIIIIDIEGEFASLREKIDAVLVGADGDIPTDLRSAALLARKIAELRVSAIIDIYELKAHERREYVRRFLDSLMSLPKELWGPMIVVIDEAHKLCPEKGQGESVATQPVIDLMSQGGKRQYCGILITQRFSKLHNDAIAEANNVCIGRTWMDADQARAGKYLGMSAAERIALREIPQGEFYAFGPALSHSGIIRFKGDKAETKPPKPGERHKIKPPKPSDVITHIISQIDDLPEVAEQEAKDIASVKEAARQREGELKSEIQSLKTELANAAKPAVQTETVSIFPEEKMTELSELIEEFFKPFSRALDAAETNAVKIENLVLDLRKAIPVEQAAAPVSEHKAWDVAVSGSIATPRPKATPITNLTPAALNGSLPEGERRILTVAAQYADRGGATREQIGILTGYAQSSRNSLISRLTTKGLVVVQGNVFATDAGIEALGDFERLPEGLALQQWWLDRLPAGESAILSVLVSAYPESVTRQAIGEATGYAQSSRNSLISRLSTKKLVIANSSEIKASDDLF